MSNVIQKLFSLHGKTALITGASGGIGRALAVAFAGAGAAVGIHGITPSRMSETLELIEGAGGRAVLLPGEIQEPAQCRELISQVTQQLGRLDVLVNCAGINRRKPARDVTEEDYEAITRVNLKAVFFLCQAAHQVMRGQGGGKIINIGSITSTDGLAGVSVYGMTKSAVAQLTKTLALEWAGDNIQVNCLAPGFILTPLTETGIWKDEYKSQWLTGRIPAGRLGRPDELAGAALLLASNASSYITGQVINVDGGYLAGGSWLKEGE